MSELVSFSMWQWTAITWMMLINLIFPFLPNAPFKHQERPRRSFYVGMAIILSLGSVVLLLMAFSERADNAFRELVILLTLVFTVQGAARCNELRKVTK